MRLVPTDPPRAFAVGRHTLKDCGRVELAPDEQVTFVTESGGEYDVARKSWGFYATPSLNRRLARFGLRPALVKSPSGAFYIVLVERGHEEEFEAYRQAEGHTVVTWLDSDRELEALARKATCPRP